MFAAPVGQKSQTFAATVARAVDADVVEMGQPQAMNREAATTDIAGDFLEHVMLGASLRHDAQDADAKTIRLPK